MPDEKSVNEFTMEELDSLFNSEFEQEAPPVNNETDSQETGNDASKTDDVDTTKAFAKRLKESTDKVRREERDAIAKSLGYSSYDELQKSRENKLIEDKGLDPDEVSPIVDELVKKRLDDDPRMKELAELRKKQVEDFGKKELEEIKKLTDGEITSLNQLSKEVIDLWKKKGSLKSAYLELEGEKLITKIKGEQSKGNTSHLNVPNGSTSPKSNERPLTDKEKQMFKFFNRNISDEELNKRRVKIEN